MVKKKKLLISTVCIIICLLIFQWINNPERRIFSMVQKNQAEYVAVAETVLSGGEKTNIEGVNKIYVRSGKHRMVDFFVTGFGVAPSSTYYGFYYSPEDLALPYLEENAILTEYKEDAWKWQGSGDNKGVTKKIADCWYYYEASF